MPSDMRRWERGDSVLKKLKFGLGLIAIFYSFGSFAQTSGTSGRFEAFVSAGYLGMTKSALEYEAAPGFQWVPLSSLPWLQFGAEVTYQKMSFRGGTTSNIIGLAGFTANVGPNQNDAFFVSLGPAYRTGSASGQDDGTTDPNGIGFYFFTGKRFPISGALALRPSFGVVSCGTTGMVFRPFALSYLF